jgi:hypothetical protein
MAALTIFETRNYPLGGIMPYEFFFTSDQDKIYRVMADDFPSAIRMLSEAEQFPEHWFEQIEVKTIYGNSSRETRTTEAETVQEAKTNPSTETKQT